MNAAPGFQPGILELSLLGIGSILLLVAFVCTIVVIIKMFQNNQTALGVVTVLLLLCSGIGQLIALVVGWMKVSEWNIKGVMVAFTASFLIGTALVMGGYGILMMKVINDPQFQQQMQEINAEANQMPEIVVD